MANGPTTNLPNGITNVVDSASLGTYINPDPSAAHEWFNDFDNYTSGQWTVTETQGAATQAITAGDGGLLALVNSTANNDLNAIQWTNEIFTFESGKRLWCKARFKIDDATSSALVVGLQTTDTTPLTTANGVFFRKSAASTTLNLVVCKSSTETVTAVTTMADNTNVVVGFAYDGVSAVVAYAAEGSAGQSVTTNLPTVTLAPQIAVSNGTSAAKTLTIDYLMFAKER